MIRWFGESFKMQKIERVKIIGVNISVVNFESAQEYLFNNFELARGKYICAANVHTTVTAREDSNYRNIQNSSFMTLPDGKPLSVVGKKRGKKTMGRVTGPDFLEEVLKKTENTEMKHYFYGTTQENLDSFISVVKKSYPNLNIVGVEPSVFRPLTEQEEDELLKRINESEADFVWVALGAPRQEIFCNKLSSRSNAVWVAVGGALNVISGVIPRAPQWMQDHGLEWFYRFMKEPKRLFKRYFVTNSKFLWYLFRDKGVK